MPDIRYGAGFLDAQQRAIAEALKKIGRIDNAIAHLQSERWTHQRTIDAHQARIDEYVTQKQKQEAESRDGK